MSMHIRMLWATRMLVKQYWFASRRGFVYNVDCKALDVTYKVNSNSRYEGISEGIFLMNKIEYKLMMIPSINYTLKEVQGIFVSWLKEVSSFWGVFFK